MANRDTPEWREYYRKYYRKRRDAVRAQRSDVLCACGCGEYTEYASKSSKKMGWVRGQPLRYVNNHHSKEFITNPALVAKRAESSRSIESRVKKSLAIRAIHGSGGVVLSPYIPDQIIRFAKQSGYWNARRRLDGKMVTTHHAKAVWEYHFGLVPEGYEVHHRDGRHREVEDDRPENLLAVPRTWNRDYFPSLQSGFGVTCQQVTDAYVEAVNRSNEDDLFAEVCRILLTKQTDKCLRIPN